MSVKIAKDGPVTVVAIDRPEKRSAVDPATADALRDAFTAFSGDETAKVAILTGSQGHFDALSAELMGPDPTTPAAPAQWDRRGCGSTSR